MRGALETSSTSALEKATACFDRGDLEVAESLCRVILAASPNDASGHILLGKVLQNANRPIDAQSAFRAAVKLSPHAADSWRHWAKLLKSLGELEKARECLCMALTHLPESFHIHHDLGLIFLALKDGAGADRHISRALNIEPRSEIALCHLGLVRMHQGRCDEAIAAYHAGIAINPSVPELHNNLGDALKERDLDAAERAFSTATALRPDFAEALDSLGVIYFFKGRLEDALDKFDEALLAKPGLQRAKAHKTTTLFLLERLPEAWRLYRDRYAVAGYKRMPHGRFQVPVWNGEPFAGKALLVWTDLGLGEEILQAGMLLEVLASALCLTVECSPRLVRLFARSFPVATIIPRTNPTRACPVPVVADYQIAAGDLGAIFRDRRAKFPLHTGYLTPDPEKVSTLRQRYARASAEHMPGNMIVGLSWASHNADLGMDKTLALSEFAPLLRQPGVTFVNLQYGAARDEAVAVAAAMGIDIQTDQTVDPSGDMDDVAAQAAAMDLIISVSSTVVHMAGALNVPVWNLVPGHRASGMWHWFSDSENSAWYPSMRIYRRTQEKNQELMDRLAGDLEELCSHAGPRG